MRSLKQLLRKLFFCLNPNEDNVETKGGISRRNCHANASMRLDLLENSIEKYSSRVETDNKRQKQEKRELKTCPVSGAKTTNQQVEESEKEFNLKTILTANEAPGLPKVSNMEDKSKISKILDKKHSGRKSLNCFKTSDGYRGTQRGESRKREVHLMNADTTKCQPETKATEHQRGEKLTIISKENDSIKASEGNVKDAEPQERAYDVVSELKLRIKKSRSLGFSKTSEDIRHSSRISFPKKVRESMRRNTVGGWMSWTSEKRYKQMAERRRGIVLRTATLFERIKRLRGSDPKPLLKDIVTRCKSDSAVRRTKKESLPIIEQRTEDYRRCNSF